MRCQAAADDALAGDRRARRPRPCWSAAPASTCEPSSTASSRRARGPTIRAELEAEPDTARLHDPPRAVSTRWPRPGWSRRTVAEWCGPSRSRSAAGGRSAASARASTTYPPTDVRPGRPALVARRRSPGGSSSATTAQLDAGFLAEVAALGRPPGRAVAARPARPSATTSCSTTSRAGARSTRPSSLGHHPHPAVRRAPGAVVPA